MNPNAPEGIAHDALNTAAAGAPADAMRLIGAADRLINEGRHDEAIDLYRAWLAGHKTPLAYIVQFNLGVILSQVNRHAEAESAYRVAIATKPDFAAAWFNLGSVLERLGRKDHALTIWQSMLDHPLVSADLNRDMYLMVLNAMGRLSEEMRQFDRAEAKLRLSLLTDPTQNKVIQHWAHLRQKQCEWPVFSGIDGLEIGEMLKATSPLAMLSASDDPGLQMATAARFVKERVDLRVAALAPEQGYGHDKLRIGFLSSDFCLHAVSLLTVELFELLDRDRFELHGYCWSREDGSELRARVVRAFDRYTRVIDMDDATAARAIREHEIDILVDLQGLTSGARPNILSYRPAPVQITYLGFPGPTGHPCIDYVIADRYLIPEAEKPFYLETPLYLPNVFQCSDRKRPVAPLPSRADCGLPEGVFVFCSFNNNYKFTPEVFASWMRILKAVPDSLLWLLADNPWSQANLSARAAEQGIDPARLLFAPRVAPELYLARYTAADLFLDAYPFNAGTTANDALWMGLPVLTRSGRTFASRMAGSLLNALDLPELITTTLVDYEARAIEIATRPALHADLKRRLVVGRSQSPLFDMPRFVRDFGDALSAVAKKQP
jgi:predicted O-linked N-acetylglucosamine transferase (SPINDLY family)